MKEQTEKEKSNHNFWHRNQRLFIIALIFLLVIAAFSIVFYPTKLKHISEQNTVDENKIKITAVEDQPSSNPTTEAPVAVKSAEDYYNEGQNSMTAQNWEEAITSFDQAIALNAKNPDYYNRKSQAQYNLGKKDQAIAILQAGIIANPDSDLLKSRLDVLQKASVGSQPQ